MNVGIKCTKNEIILENAFTRIKFNTTSDTLVTEAVRLDNGNSYLASEESHFISIYKENDEIAEIKKITLDKNVLIVESEGQKIRIEVKAYERYFIFEVLNDISLPLEKIEFANIICEYETEGENLWGAVGLAMTINTNPMKRPRAKEKRVRAQAERVTGNTKDAKYALISAPLDLHRDILKEVSETIDKNKGLVLHTSGAWAKDYMPNRQNYTILIGTKKEFVEKADEYKSIGVDQFDFHQGTYSFTQGNFKCTNLPSMSAFNEEFSEPLAQKGIITSLHTYTHYIHPSCSEYLADPKWQKDLCRGEEYTLKEDISADSLEIPVEQSLKELSTNYTFFSKSLPYMLIGNEIFSYLKEENKFVSCSRGVCGTKAVPHKKGEKIYHLIGYWNLFSPVPGSPLFIEIAHSTARAYNQGGFKMMYIDAMDGMHQHTNKAWYYDALFTHEILKNCNSEPIMEFADHPAGMWAVYGRSGAWDYPWKAYKKFNKFHVKINQKDMDDAHLVATMGWYNHYPQLDSAPGNYTCQYHHWDDAEYVSSLCLIHGYGMVIRGGIPSKFCPAYSRNIDIYLKYYNLMQSKYFSDEYLNKLKDPDKEYHLKNKGKDKWIFEEKAFETHRYFACEDAKHNKNKFTNPFKSQKPFVRIETCLSTLGTNEMLLLPIDENKQLPKEITHSFGSALDLSNNSAIKVRIHGNGKKESAVRICLISRGLKAGESVDYIVDTDFRGWREYVFYESHKGEREDLPFDSRHTHFYNVHLKGIRINEVNHITIDTEGDIEGVRMGNIYGCKAVYDVIKNPTVKIGKSEVTFKCEVKSSDFIEFDGEKAEVLDRYGFAKPVAFIGELKAPHGAFTAEVSGTSLNGATINTRLTFGFTGKEIK